MTPHTAFGLGIAATAALQLAWHAGTAIYRRASDRMHAMRTAAYTPPRDAIDDELDHILTNTRTGLDT